MLRLGLGPPEFDTDSRSGHFVCGTWEADGSSKRSSVFSDEVIPGAMSGQMVLPLAAGEECPPVPKVPVPSKWTFSNRGRWQVCRTAIMDPARSCTGSMLCTSESQQSGAVFKPLILGPSE